MTAEEFKALAMSFPGAVDGHNMGSDFVKVNGKDLARMLSAERVYFTGVPVEEVEMLTEVEPETYWADAHYKNARCIVAQLTSLDPAVARRLVERRFRQTAKKAVLREWDAGR